MKKYVVEMGSLGCTIDSDTSLVTSGISTCIAFALNGTFYDEEDNLKEFCALFHWSGFFNNEQDPVGHVETVFEDFLDDVRESLKLEDDEKITINQLAFIGGEKKQCDAEGHTLVSGTEAEVNALIEALKEFDFDEYNYTLKQSAEHHHFLTSDTATIEVEVQLTSCTFAFEHAPEVLDDSKEPSDHPRLS